MITAEELKQQFTELKEAGKINSELDAFIEGQIWAKKEELTRLKEDSDG
jgi:hypothetical protein